MSVRATQPANPPSILKELGNCGKPGIDTNIFFPTHGGCFKPAMKMCSDCPVRRQCAEFAIENSEYGCWGGTTEDDRKEIRRFRKGEPEPWPVGLAHGSMKKSVRAHSRMGELACDECYEAWTKGYPNIIINLKSKDPYTRNEYDS